MGEGQAITWGGGGGEKGQNLTIWGERSVLKAVIKSYINKSYYLHV